MDHFGRTIPERLRPTWNRREEIEALKSRISEVRVALRKARDAGDPVYTGVPQDVLTWLDNSYSELDNCKPYAVCPWCGDGKPSCKMCRGSGFVSQFQFDTFATAEMKAAVREGGAR